MCDKPSKSLTSRKMYAHGSDERDASMTSSPIERDASMTSSPIDFIRSSHFIPTFGDNEGNPRQGVSNILFSQSCRSSKSSPSHLLSETAVSQSSTDSPKLDHSFFLSPDSETGLLDDNRSEALSSQNLLSFIPDAECLSPILDHSHRLTATGRTSVPLFTSPEWSSSTLTSDTKLSLPTSDQRMAYVDHDFTNLSDNQKKNLSLFLDSSDDEDDRNDEDVELELIYNSTQRIPRARHLKMRRSTIDPFEPVNDVSF